MRTASTATAFKYQATVPEILAACADIHPVIDQADLDPTIRNLIYLRASQINQCAFCINMHLRESRDHGESETRLDQVIVWDQASVFTDAERAVLAWTESLTVLNPRDDRAALREQLVQHFTPTEIGAITANIAMINLWNRINVSRH